jgi:hypothetical protein
MEPYPDRASLIVHQGLELEVGEADLKLLGRRHKRTVSQHDNGRFSQHLTQDHNLK